MKHRYLLAGLALGLGACRQSPTAPADLSQSQVRQSAHLRFAPRCTSVWDISVDGRSSGLLLFSGAHEHYDVDAGAGPHQFSATRWAPSDALVLEGMLPPSRDTVITLTCS